jgi:hypothetical protein
MQVNRLAARHRRRFRVTLSGHPSAFTLDVGAGGFCTELMRVLPAGSRVYGSLLVKGAEVAFAGLVAWAKPGEARMSLRGRMGVRFTRIPQDFATLVNVP